MPDKQGIELQIKGLPNGYAGTLYIVGPDFPEGNYGPMHGRIAPRSTKYGGKADTFWAFVWPIEEEYICCGVFVLDLVGEEIVPDTSDVWPEHQRKGILNAIYDFLEEVTEYEVVPDHIQSQAAQNFWSKRNGSKGKK